MPYIFTIFNSIRHYMKKEILLFIIAVIVNSVSWSQKPSDLREKLLQQYAGEWTSIDSNTRNITKVIIKNTGNMTVQAFGSCAPKDCELGTTELYLISDSVDNSSNVIPFDHCLAIWDMEYAKHIMKFRIQTGPSPQLHVDNTVVFKDNSGRSNYNLFTILKKAN